MKHVPLTEDQARDLYLAITTPSSFKTIAGSSNKWLTENLRFERVEVTDEMLKTYDKVWWDCKDPSYGSHKAGLQAILDRYVNTQPKSEPAQPSAPDTFVVGGYTFTRHKAGDPMPCDPKDQVIVCFRDGGTNGPDAADFWDWRSEFGDNSKDPITGWRYAEPPQPSEADSLRQELAAAKVKVEELEKRYTADMAEMNQRLIEQTRSSIAKMAELRGALKSAPARLLPITPDMPPVAEGCVRVTGFYSLYGAFCTGPDPLCEPEFYCDIQLPEPAPQPDPLAQERLEFEEKMKDQWGEHDYFEKDDEGKYANDGTQFAWEAWVIARGIKETSESKLITHHNL